MSPAREQAIREIRSMLDEAKGDLADAQKVVGRIPDLTADIEALERSLRRAQGVNGAAAPALPEQSLVRTPIFRKSAAIPKTEMVLGILREAGRPLTVSEVMDAVRAKAPDAKRMTIISHLSRFAERKLIRRIGTGTYEFVR